MKHLIFLGKPRSGKSLFAKIIFNRENSLFIEGVDCNINDRFLFDNDRATWNYENLIIDDPRSKKFRLEDFAQYFTGSEMSINRRFKGVLKVKTPRFIFIIDSESKINIPTDGSFLARFTIIDFDSNTIADLTKTIDNEKILINTSW